MAFGAARQRFLGWLTQRFLGWLNQPTLETTNAGNRTAEPRGLAHTPAWHRWFLALARQFIREASGFACPAIERQQRPVKFRPAIPEKAKTRAELPRPLEVQFCHQHGFLGRAGLRDLFTREVRNE